MKKGKKILSMLLVVACISALFAGCGSQASSSASGAAELGMKFFKSKE